MDFVRSIFCSGLHGSKLDWNDDERAKADLDVLRRSNGKGHMREKDFGIGLPRE